MATACRAMILDHPLIGTSSTKREGSTSKGLGKRRHRKNYLIFALTPRRTRLLLLLLLAPQV